MTDKLMLLHCLICGWVSDELTSAQMSERGVPWYCDNCGRQGLKFIHFIDEEREQALAEWKTRIDRWKDRAR